MCVCMCECLRHCALIQCPLAGYLAQLFTMRFSACQFSWRKNFTRFSSTRPHQGTSSCVLVIFAHGVALSPHFLLYYAAYHNSWLKFFGKYVFIVLNKGIRGAARAMSGVFCCLCWFSTRICGLYMHSVLLLLLPNSANVQNKPPPSYLDNH